MCTIMNTGGFCIPVGPEDEKNSHYLISIDDSK